MKLQLLACALTAVLSLSCDNHPQSQQGRMNQSDANSTEDQLQEYADKIIGKIPGGARSNGAYAGMTVAESAFSDMWYFWQASIINSGDVAGYFSWLDARRADLEAIGAQGCLRALEALRPHYEKAVKEGTEANWPKGDPDYRKLIESLEVPAFEDDWEELLLSFAKTHLSTQPE
jgi:hypothetical protein